MTDDSSGGYSGMSGMAGLSGFIPPVPYTLPYTYGVPVPTSYWPQTTSYDPNEFSWQVSDPNTYSFDNYGDSTYTDEAWDPNAFGYSFGSSGYTGYYDDPNAGFYYP